MKEWNADRMYQRTGVHSRNWAIMLAVFVLFILSGFVHVYTVQMDYASCLCQFLYGGVVIYWAVTITRRIIDRRVRYMMLATATFLLLYFILQICRDTLFAEIGLIPHYLWYAYYIPMAGVPMTLFFISLYMNRQDDESIPRGWWLLLIPSTMLVFGYLTNEFHHLAFRFPVGAPPYTEMKEYGVLSLLFWLFIALLMQGTMMIAIHKCRLTVSRKLMWVPMMPILFGGLYFMLDVGNQPLRIGQVPFLNPPEVFAFMAISFLENCIQIGIIPANMKYERLFEMMMLPAVIVDKAGRQVYASRGARDGYEPGPEMQERSAPIYGGEVRWVVDFSEVHALNQELQEVNEQIQARNKYLLTQHVVLEEQAAFAARKAVYDRITEILQPQLRKIEDLTREEAHFPEHLAEIAVYNAYIKRRSNLELVQDGVQFLPLTELYLSVKESTDYLHLYGVETLVSGGGRGRYAAGAILLAYEFFEYVVETTMQDLRMLSTTIQGAQNQLAVRMLMQMEPGAEERMEALDSAWRANDVMAWCGHIEKCREGCDTWMILTMDIVQVPETVESEEYEQGGDAR